MSDAAITRPSTAPTSARAATNNRQAGTTALVAAGTMIVGSVLWASTGTDIDAALADGTVATYLADATQHTTVLAANLSVWIVGALLLGIANIQLASVTTERVFADRLAHYAAVVGAAVAVVAFVVWLALVTQLAPAANGIAEPVAATLAWIASRADWIATVLLVAVAPASIALAARGDWMPTWLGRWAALAALAGGLTVVAMFTDGLSTYGFLVVPVGLGWMMAAGFYLIRRS